MKKSAILEMLEPFENDDEISFDGELFLFSPEKVCGKQDRLMGYVCCLEPNHKGRCFSINKKVYFDEFEDEI